MRRFDTCWRPWLTRDLARNFPLLLLNSTVAPKNVNESSLVCPQCGRTLKPNAPAGLCPPCLLRCGLSDSDDASPTVSQPKGESRLENLRYFGDYELVEQLGRGGMGVVFRARQTSLNRIVAIKLILSGEWASPDF